MGVPRPNIPTCLANRVTPFIVKSSAISPMLAQIESSLAYFLQPVRFLRGYELKDLRPDALAGLTVAIVLLPQAIAYALIAELPPQMGLYSAIVAAIVGALWGSSNQLHTGPSNSASLLVLAILLPLAEPGTGAFIAAAGLMAVMVGVFRLVLGLARLGMLVNFVSDSVIIGFTAGAGVLITANQLRNLLRLEFRSEPGLVQTLQQVGGHISETHWLTLAFGLGVVMLIVVLRLVKPDLPGPLIAMGTAAALVGILGLEQQGLRVIGELPRSLPPLAEMHIFDAELIGQLLAGSLAVGAIGLVEAMSIARSVASQTGQRLDSNQEFVGQGLASIACGLFSGYPISGSFARSGVNYRAGAVTPMASIYSGVFVLLGMVLLAPLAAYIPRTALAGVLLVTAFSMVDLAEIARIWRSTQGDAMIMVMTFLATIFLPLQYAVLTGILLSFAVYILRTSTPSVVSVLPGDNFRHFFHQPDKPECPQLAIFDIRGDLYFGAVNHVEETLHEHLSQNPGQWLLMLRMHNVNQCDISGIHALESILRALRDRGGDLFLVRVRQPVLELMKSSGFYQQCGLENFLSEDEAIHYLFHRVIDPAICIYECEVRAFRECQNLPKRILPEEFLHTAPPAEKIKEISPRQLWQALHGEHPPRIIDVREPREFQRGHIAEANLIPLPRLLSGGEELSADRAVVFVCRSGRRSKRAAFWFASRAGDGVMVLEGGMLAWEARGLLEAVEEFKDV